MAKKKKKKTTKHTSEKFSFKGILSRNDSYRLDCRANLAATTHYDNVAVILAGIKKRDADPNKKGGVSPALVKGKTQAQRVLEYVFNFVNVDGEQNFAVGYHPYPNQAHHVVPVELFYDDKWKGPHLHIVLASGYDINAAENIIILPQCGKASKHPCFYHNLPDHGENHDQYSLRLLAELDDVYDMAEEATTLKKCEREDLGDDIRRMIEQSQTKNFNHLLGSGPTMLT